MKRTEIIQILRSTATVLDESGHDFAAMELRNCANSLVVLKEPLETLLYITTNDDLGLDDQEQSLIEIVKEFVE